MAARASSKVSKSSSSPRRGSKSTKSRKTGSQDPRTPTLLDVAAERWRELGRRLRLSEPALDIGARLLRAELDPQEHARMMPGEPAGTSVRRGRLLDQGELETVAKGLIELEQRAVIVPVSSGEWLSAEIALDARVRGCCISGPAPVAAPSVNLEASAFPDRVRRDLAAAVDRIATEPRRFVVVLRGRPGSGRDTLASLLPAQLGTAITRRTPDELRGAFDALEPELSGKVALWDAAGLDPSPEDLRRAAAWLARSSTVAIAIVDPHQDAPELPEREIVLMEPEPRDVIERTEVWSRALASAPGAENAAGRLARRNRAAAGLASRAVRSIELDAGEDELVSRVERQLAVLARPSSLRGIVVEHPNVSMSRLVLETGNSAAVARVAVLAHSAPEDTDRRGVKAIFSGESGTGKTLAARAIATDLRLPLFRVDLATVVSKWVGETEKNLRLALDAAQSAGAVLLFDEGDALFAKRGEVQRGTDRYANMETSYLLQALEAQDGVVIVTTNMSQSIDSAFVRRFDVCVHFQKPTAALRAALWRQELGPAADDVSQQFVLRTLAAADISGGNIAGAARLARALAAHRGASRVSEDDLTTAIGSEFDKMGATVEAQGWYSRRSEACSSSSNAPN